VRPPANTGPAATCHDANATTATAADFTATIDWGDGSPAAGGTLAGSGGSYTVDGSHTYTVPGSFTVEVHILDDGGSTADATTTIGIFALAAGGNFVIGDGEQAVGHDVTFW